MHQKITILERNDNAKPEILYVTQLKKKINNKILLYVLISKLINRPKFTTKCRNKTLYKSK